MLGICITAGLPAEAQPINIDTGGGGFGGGWYWDNSTSRTYGQTFVVPGSGNLNLRGVEFGVSDLGSGFAGMHFRAVVYAWSVTTIIGNALLEAVSGIPSLAANERRRLSVTLSGSPLIPNTPYVLLLTTIGTAQSSPTEIILDSTSGGNYAAGSVVGNLSDSLAGQYASTPDHDLDLLLFFSPPPVPTPRTHCSGCRRT
jgi:hypothetical protein